MKDITNKYAGMIESFECDFSLASDKHSLFNIGKLQEKINTGDKRMLNDIELLKELSFNIRHNKIKIIQNN